MGQEAGELAALGYEQREVVEPAVTGCRPCARFLREHYELAFADTEPCLARFALQGPQPDRLLVVRQRALEL
jgi:hypothetical protein